MTDRGKFCTLCFGVYVVNTFFLSINRFTPSFLHFLQALKKDSPSGGSCDFDRCSGSKFCIRNIEIPIQT